jgi:hypothetical protein
MLLGNLPIRVQWFSQLDGIHQQKDAKKIFFKMFVKKDFQLDKPTPANLHSTISNKYPYMYSMTPTFFYFVFNIWVSENAEFYADFKSVEIIWIKCT